MICWKYRCDFDIIQNTIFFKVQLSFLITLWTMKLWIFITKVCMFIYLSFRSGLQRNQNDREAGVHNFLKSPFDWEKNNIWTELWPAPDCKWKAVLLTKLIAHLNNSPESRGLGLQTSWQQLDCHQAVQRLGLFSSTEVRLTPRSPDILTWVWRSHRFRFIGLLGGAACIW